MKKTDLRLIKGGLDDSADSREKTFISAYVTDTRLMGVMCMYIHWITDDEDLHQFFYLDCEENGFENYRSIHGNDMAEIASVEQSLAGGLGGREIDISEREAKALLAEYVNFNRERNIALPKGEEEYSFLIDEKPELSETEKEALMKKECTVIKSDYQLINYFLMRCFGHDYRAAEFLSSPDISVDIYDEYSSTGLYSNVIDEETPGLYLCESLIESGNSYHVIISEIEVKDMKVISFKNCSGFKVSSKEAAMIVARPEFVTVYDILTSPEIFDMAMMELSMNTMVTTHENGRLYMVFNKNNDHVNKRVFKMNEDVYGIYYVTCFGQLIAAAYSIENIHNLERDLRKSDLSTYLALVSKYEFKEPVLYDFVQSDFDDFEEFLEFISDNFYGDDK